MPDGCINPHPRFAALVRNIRSRRGSTVEIRAPLFRDAKTPEFAGLPPPPPPPSKGGGTGGGGSASIKEEDGEDRTLLPSARGSKAHAEGYVWQLDGLSLEEEEGEGQEQEGAAEASPVTASGKAAGEAKEGKRKGPEVVMDAMAYGMGMCCLQVRFGAAGVWRADRRDRPGLCLAAYFHVPPPNLNNTHINMLKPPRPRR